MNARLLPRRMTLALPLCVLLLAPLAQAGDWPYWRGPEQNGVSRETGLPDTWTRDGENMLWKAPYGGRSTPVVMDGRVYILNRAGSGPTETERVMCLDGETGKVLWEHRFNVFLSDIHSHRVGWSSPVGDPTTGKVYVHGVQNTFLCLDRDGKVLWDRQLHEEYGTIMGYGGRTHTPVVDGDLVIISFLNSSWGAQSRGAHRYLALDKRTGDVVWWSEPGGRPLDTTYSTPVVAVVNGTRLLMGGNADGGVYAMKIGTGEKVWGFGLSKRGINSSVVFWDDKVFATHSEENLDTTTMGRVVAIDATGEGDVTKTHEVWRLDGITAGYSSPALHDGKLYVINNAANLHCIDAREGKLLWDHSLGTVMKGSPVWADGKIYVGEVNAHFLIVKPGEDGCRTLSEVTFPSPDNTVTEVNGSPAVSDGRIYFTTRDTTYCVGHPEWKGQHGIPPPVAAAPPATPQDAPARLMIAPADVVVAPGDRLSFEGHLYNARGQLLRACRPEWSLQGLQGSVSNTGVLEVPEGAGYDDGLLVAEHESLSAKARIRIVPPPPVSFDFSDLEEGSPPAGWIGAGVKFVGATVDSEKVLSKDPSNAKFMHGETFFGLPEWKDYTIQADIRATETRRNLPNAGLVNTRYSLLIEGNRQKLRIVSWVPMPRVDKTQSFRFDPDIWYRMKFRVDVEDGRGIARGKVWPRKDPEPDAWTIELEDPQPNTEGSPGLQAYSAGTTASFRGAGLFFDNVQVVPNGS